jgi:hypothetical protein
MKLSIRNKEVIATEDKPNYNVLLYVEISDTGVGSDASFASYFPVLLLIFIIQLLVALMQRP